MRGFVIDKYVKSVDELSGKLKDDAPEPKAGGNDVLIDVHSAALNFFGQCMRWPATLLCVLTSPHRSATVVSNPATSGYALGTRT